MTKILWEYRYIIIVAVFVIMYCILRWNETKSKLYALMLQAKSLAKDAVLKSGDEQLEWVVKKSYQCLPLSLRVFLSEDLMRKIIKWLYKQGKDLIDDGKLNSSIK